MKSFVAMLAFATLAAAAHAQNAWQSSTIHDELRQSTYQQFVLRGKYLVPPKTMQPGQFPALVVQCLPKQHSVGYHVFVNGSFLDGYLVAGTVVNSQVTIQEGLSGTSFPVVVPVEFRLDDGKLQSDSWRASTDYGAAFFPEDAFDNLLYGHQMPHKENSNPQVRKVIIGIDEALAGEVQIEFDMPDANDIAEACGVVIHKKQKKQSFQGE
jgi:hypothetical protein